MALVVEVFVLSTWQDLTLDIPLLGDPTQGIVPFQLEKTRESNVSVLRFGVNQGSADKVPGTEIRVMVDGVKWFGGYITTRELMRQGPFMYSANYECQDYNSLLDRIVVPSYTIDDGDTDSTEIETLRSTYLNSHGVTAGDIQTVQASMEKVKLQGTFRQCMETIAGQAGGATFYITSLKALNYAAVGADFSISTSDNLSDDLTVLDSHPYGDFVERLDETRRINRVYIVGDGIEGWYPAADSGEAYQKIVYDDNVTTQDALDALGAAITGDFGSALTEHSLRCWEDAFWTVGTVTVRHSDFIGGSGSDLWIRRAMMICLSDDGSDREFILEFGDHTVDSDNLGGGGGYPGSSRSPPLPHALLGTFHSDTSASAPVEGDLVLADATPEWAALTHPNAAGYALVTNATTWTEDQTPTWTGSHTWDDGAGNSPLLNLVGGTNDDTVAIRLLDNASIGFSDGAIDLCDDAGNSELVVRNLSGTNVVRMQSSGNIILNVNGTYVGRGAGSARFVFNSITQEIELRNADLDIATSGKGIVHADGNTSGYILMADGTRYIPAAANANLPIAPGNRGDIIRAEAGPVWAAYGAATDGAILIGDGTDIISDTTPQIAGNVRIGAADLGSRTLAIAGAATGSAEGGQLNLELAADHDGIFESWNIDVFQNDLRFFSSDAAVINMMTAEGQLVLPTAGSGAGILIGGDAQWYRSGANVMATPDALLVGGLATFSAGWVVTSGGGTGDLDGNDLIIDTDGDSYLHASGDDVVDLVLATALGEFGITINSAEDFTFTANSLNILSGSVVTMADDTTIRLAATGGQIIFDSTPAPDQIKFRYADLVIEADGGTDVMTFRRSGDLNAESDILFDGSGGIAAADGVYLFMDANNDGVDNGVYLMRNAERADTADMLFYFTEAEVFGGRLEGIAHGGTNEFTYTDTFFEIQTYDSAGGAMIQGAKGSAGVNAAAVSIRAMLDENADTTKSTSGRAIVEVDAASENAGDWGDVVADGNVFAVRARRSSAWATVMIVDEDGDLHIDGTTSSYDDENDALAIRDLQRGLTGRWEQALAYNQARFQELGILGQGDQPLMSLKGVTGLTMGAIAQLYQRCQQYERAFEVLGIDPPLLEGTQ
jgi:hypothetical protein